MADIETTIQQSRSSVEVHQNAKGEMAYTVKSYAGDPITPEVIHNTVAAHEFLRERVEDGAPEPDDLLHNLTESVRLLTENGKDALLKLPRAENVAGENVAG